MAVVAVLRRSYRNIIALDAAYDGNTHHVCRSIFGAAVSPEVFTKSNHGNSTREVFWRFVRFQHTVIKAAKPDVAAVLSVESMQKGLWLLRSTDKTLPSDSVDKQYQKFNSELAFFINEGSLGMHLDLKQSSVDKTAEGETVTGSAIGGLTMNLSIVLALNKGTIALPRHCIPCEPLWIQFREETFQNYPFVRELAWISTMNLSANSLMVKPLLHSMFRPECLKDPGYGLLTDTVTTFRDYMEVRLSTRFNQKVDERNHYQFTVNIRNISAPPSKRDTASAACADGDSDTVIDERNASHGGVPKRYLKLLTFHWFFGDGSRTAREVINPNFIVNEDQSGIKPGDKFEYNSSTTLDGNGFMLGTIQFVTYEEFPDGSVQYPNIITVPIPPTRLTC